MPKPFTQHLIDIPSILHVHPVFPIPSPPQHLIHLPFPPLLLPLHRLLHHLPNLFLLSLLPIRLAIPAQLQLIRARFFKPAFDIRVFFEGLENILVGGQVRGTQGYGCEFKSDDGSEDDDECEPPVKVWAEEVQEGVADVVDCVGCLVERGETDVPEKPDADVAEDCDGVCGGFGVRFYESGNLGSASLYC